MAHSLEKLRALCRGIPSEALCVIGGESVYRLLLPTAPKRWSPKPSSARRPTPSSPDLDKLPGWSVRERSEILEEQGIRFQYVDYVNANPLEF